MSKVVIHLDLDSFFAAVEQTLQRELRGRPVAISAPRGQSIVTAVTYDAKNLGVKVGMSKNQAKILCPDLSFVTARMGAYQLVSLHVRSIVERYCKEYETLGLDECFFEVKNIIGDNIANYQELKNDEYELALEVSSKIRQEVKNELALNISAGIGSNKIVAKLATSLGKPNGLKVVAPEKELELLREQKLAKITGIGAASLAKLKPLGYEFVGELKDVKLRNLVQILGKHQGRFVYEVVNNQVTGRVVPNGSAKTMAATRKLNNKKVIIDDIFEELLGEILTRLNKQNRSCRTIDVFLQGENYGFSKKIDLMVATKNLVTLTEEARNLYKQIPKQSRAMFIGISLGRLGSYSQLELNEREYQKTQAIEPPDFRPPDVIVELNNALYRGMPIIYNSKDRGRVIEISKEGLLIEFTNKEDKQYKIFDLNYSELLEYSGLEN